MRAHVLGWQPVYNCIGLCAYLRGDYTAATAALSTTLRSFETGAKHGLAHDAFIGMPPLDAVSRFTVISSDIGGILSDLGCCLSASGEAVQAQAAFKRGLFMCSRAHQPDQQALEILRHNCTLQSLAAGETPEHSLDLTDAAGKTLLVQVAHLSWSPWLD